jgi:hypothetical protein
MSNINILFDELVESEMQFVIMMLFQSIYVGHEDFVVIGHQLWVLHIML